MNIHPKAQVNLSANKLIDLALSRNEGVLAANQALVVKTGPRTGRSPKDRFIVLDSITENTIDWNSFNQPISPERFDALWKKALNYLMQKETCFISYLKAGAHETYGLPLKIITELAWQQLFAYILFIRSDSPDQTDTEGQWTLLSLPSYPTHPTRDGVNSDAAILLNFEQRCVLICGTYYAGEIKKAMFSVLNFLLPKHCILPMHCAANMGSNGETALFFGLSGTGKTTLSATKERFLIGDDEHGWGEEEVFNFEGGCYAKCIDLSKEREPLIWNAIRYGALIENVVLDPHSKQPIYTDTSLTQNTRAAYPREFIPEYVKKNRGPQPTYVLFLSCDLYGVLPPVARLTLEQAIYYFLSGYTALVGSTEVGQSTQIQPTFSTCFGAPFFPRHPHIYSELLMQRLKAFNTTVYLINTGWVGGAQGKGGKRFSIPTTRRVVQAILAGELQQADYSTLPGFKLSVPSKIEGVETTLLHPQKAWSNPAKQIESARSLISALNHNFKRFQVSEAIKKASPTAL